MTLVPSQASRRGRAFASIVAAAALTVAVAMPAMPGRAQSLGLPRDDVVRLHRLVGDARAGDEEAFLHPHRDIAGPALVDAEPVHLAAGGDHGASQREVAHARMVRRGRPGVTPLTSAPAAQRP